MFLIDVSMTLCYPCVRNDVTILIDNLFAQCQSKNVAGNPCFAESISLIAVGRRRVYIKRDCEDVKDFEEHSSRDLEGQKGLLTWHTTFKDEEKTWKKAEIDRKT